MNPPDRTLIYRVSRGGHVMGEFDIDRIVDLLDSGEFLWTDLFWCQGMSGWTPLANLRSEVAAAKAFPPVAAMPAAVASGRRPRQPVAGASVVKPVPTPVFAGYWWVIAGVSLGALIGLLTTHFFPTVVQIDRPVDRVVEKIVEKPVEVVRVVEKRVDVPALLTAEQTEAWDYFKQRNDANLREIGVDATALLPVLEKKIKVFVYLDDVLKRSISVESVRVRIESVFIRNGFTVLPEDSKDFANTIINAGISRADSDSTTEIAGEIGLTLYQYALLSGFGIQKRAWVIPMRYENSLKFGSTHFYQLPSKFEEYATRAVADLLKAGELPYSNK
jgi:hypothetical protein